LIIVLEKELGNRKVDGEPIASSDISLARKGSMRDIHTLNTDLQGVCFTTTAAILFPSRYPYTKEVNIQNKSGTTDTFFYIQAFPDIDFTISPSLGSAKPQDGLKLILHYENQVDKPPRRNCEVNGFLRIRSNKGLALDR
jgi:hypothetical protein